MSTWTERVAGHGVWAAIETLAKAVDESSTREPLSAEALAGIERVRAVHDFVSQRISAVEQTLLVPAVLDTLTGHLAGAASELRAFIADGQDGHIANANGQADSLLTALASLPILVSGTEVRQLGRASADYRRATEAALEETERQARSVRVTLDQSEERLRAIAADISSWKERVEKQISEWQAQFSTAQDSRAGEFGTAQSSRQERFGVVVGEFQEKATQQVAELEKLRAALKSDADKALDDLSEDFGERATVLLNEMEEKKAEVEKLVGVIGNLGVTSGYLKAAAQARGEKQLWQAITVVAFLGFIAFAWDAFLPVVGDSFSWPSFAGRALLTVAVGLFAGYAAKQGDKAAQLETHNRSMALELEALGPFIAPLPVAKQEEFRESVGKAAFGGSKHLAESQGQKSPTGVLDLLREGRLQQFVTDIVKATRDK